MTTSLEKQRAMFELIETWQTSGQSQQEFCKAHGLAYSAFHYWYKKYRQRHQAEPAFAAGRAASAFIPVSVSGTAGYSPLAELVLPDGRRMNFYQGVDAAFLRALLS